MWLLCFTDSIAMFTYFIGVAKRSDCSLLVTVLVVVCLCGVCVEGMVLVLC